MLLCVGSWPRSGCAQVRMTPWPVALTLMSVRFVAELKMILRPVRERVMGAVGVGYALLFAVIAVGMLPAAAAGADWSVVPSPNLQTPQGSLAGVSCASASACAAFGGASGSPLAERWDGTSWEVETIPAPADASFTSVEGMSCSGNECIAVGTYGGGGGSMPLGERWDGSSWALQAIPTPPGAHHTSLHGVSCSSASACTAVGSSIDGAGNQVPLVERWDGASWAIQPTPNLMGASYSTFWAVSCSSAAACIAVGSENAQGFDSALAERWDGANWTGTVVPTPTDSSYSRFSAVSCSSASACTAVGVYSAVGSQVVVGGPLVERLNGTSWEIQTVATPSGASVNLSAVSCVSPSTCTLAGSSTDQSGNEAPLVERWDGTSWTVQPSSTPPGSFDVSLSGISCVSASTCVAVGTASNRTFVEAWNGTGWMIQVSPTPDGPLNGHLSGLSCLSASDCIAVGDSSNTTLAERWDGTSWMIQPTPNPSAAPLNRLADVSCVSANDCIAVGYYETSGYVPYPLAEHWDGANWEIQTVPAPNGFLASVSCVAATWCTAVGYSGGAPLVEHWDGASWTIQAGPTPIDGYLSGVSCASASACVAVGYSQGPGYNGELPLLERWDGSGWAVQSVPVLGSSRLRAVSCFSASACTAIGTVGFHSSMTGYHSTGDFAERWDGAGWTRTVLPGPAESILSGVSCAWPDRCIAVGSSSDVTLAQAWDGKSWATEPTPNPAGALSSDLSAVSCTRPGVCMAVGTYDDMTLAEEGTAESPIVVPPPATPPVASVPGRIGTLGGLLKFSFICEGAAGAVCQGQVTATAIEKLSANGTKITAVLAGKPRSGRYRVVTIVKGNLSAAAGRRKDVSIGLNSTGQMLRNKFRNVPVDVKVTATTTGHATTIKTAKVTFGPDPPMLHIAGSPSTKRATVTFKLRCNGLSNQLCRGAGKITTFENLGADGKTITGLAYGPFGKGRTVRLATVSYAVKAGRTIQMSIEINRIGKNLVTRFRRVPATLKLMPSYNGYTLTAATAKITCKR